MQRDLTYYRTRTERTSFGTTYIPYPYDGPLTYTVAKEAINNMTGQAYKIHECKRTRAPKTLTSHHQNTLERTHAALTHLYGASVANRLYDAAQRNLQRRIA